MKTTTITYASHDGRSTIRALLWEPDAPNDRAPLRGLVQLVHGMSEHVERYEEFAAFLCGQGYAVCANDHIGHGKTASCREDLGHMPLEEGEDVLLQDVHALRELVIERLIASGTASKGIPYVIFGGILGTIPYWMMYFGILDCSIFPPPYVGVFLEGFLTNLDYMSIVANAIQMVLSILIWFPFFKIYEKSELAKEAEFEAKKAAGVDEVTGGSVTISDDDMKLLDDMDLDF